MRDLTTEPEPQDRGLEEDEIRKCLEREQSTGGRQELLKALWRLSQEHEQAKLRTEASTVAASSTTQPQPAGKSTGKSENFAVSC